jgi:CheY-like chemotaxis protein
MPTSSVRKVLVVEDQREKSQAIRECLSEADEQFEVVETDTIVIAGHLLSSGDAWSGIVLDLSFRRTQQVGSHLSRPYLAGLEILQQLNEMRLDYPVIVATQHDSFVSTKYGDFKSTEELIEVLQDAFPANFRELIEVDLGGSDWRTALTRAVRRHFR